MSEMKDSDWFRQGDLDGACGIYAIVNAYCVALGENKHTFNSESTEFYQALVKGVSKHERGGLVLAGLLGVGTCKSHGHYDPCRKQSQSPTGRTFRHS